jgi:outer membrane lipoprotein SlyB
MEVLMIKLHPSANVLFLAGLLSVGGCQPQDANSTEATADSATAPVDESKAVATNSTQPQLKAAATPPPAPACNNCGKVSSITPVTVKGESSGVGAAVGAIVGGLAGNQVGGGSGKRIATVIGVAGGALAGNAIERNRNASTYFDVVIAMDDGSYRTISVDDASALATGTAVIVEGENIRLR